MQFSTVAIIATAGLVSAQAYNTTATEGSTSTELVTITSCGPEVTSCPARSTSVPTNGTAPVVPESNGAAYANANSGSFAAAGVVAFIGAAVLGL